MANILKYIILILVLWVPQVWGYGDNLAFEIIAPKASGSFYVTNCVAFNNTTDLAISNGFVTYTATDDATTGTGNVDISPGATESTEWAKAFTDYANGDFSIKDTDSVLYNAGTDLSATFTTDIKGTTRSTWDIGAFEYGGE